MKLTPKQSAALIKALNAEYKNDAKTAKTQISDFYGASPNTALYTLDQIRDYIAKYPTPKQILWQRLEKLMGPEKLQKFAHSYIRVELVPKPTPEAFLTLKGPETKEITISAYEKFSSDSNEFSDEILRRLTAQDRKALIKKFDFDADWKQYSDKSDWRLSATVPVKKVFLALSFQLDKFLPAARKRLEREETQIDEEAKEVLIEKLTGFFNAIGIQEQAAGEDEDLLAENYADYAEEDAKGRSLKELKDQLDSDITEYIERLEALGIDEDAIQEALIESGESEFSQTHYRVDNTIGYSSCPSEEEVQFDDPGRYEDEMAAAGLPYPQDLNANLSLLDAADLEELKRKVTEMSIRFGRDEASDGYRVQDGTVYFGDDRSFHLVVQEDMFFSKAKRLLKDAKLEKRGTQKRVASVDPDEFPLLAKVLRVT